MASPVMPPPQMPAPPRPPRSMAGAVVLILLGLMFLMGTMGIFNWHGLTMLFGRYWPALLILWGVIKLIEHEQSKRAGLPGRGIGVGGVFLMLFLIMAGLIATGASRVDWGNIRDHLQLGDNDVDEIFGGSSFDYDGELNSALPAGTTGLRINDERGTITVNVADDKKLRVSWRKKVHAENQQEADSFNKKTDVTITPADKVMVLNANTQGAGDKGVSVDMDIYIPRNTDLVITSRRGDVTVTGTTGSVDVNHQRGEVNLSDLTGNATLNVDRSSARVQHIKGDVTIQGRANEIAIEDVDGAVHLNGEFQESVRLVRVSKTVSFHSSRTDMEFARLDGRLDLDSGDLRADSLAGPMHLTTRSKDIALQGLSGDLRLEDTNGTVEVGLHNPGNIQIDNRKGDVQITIPPDTAIKVEARTRDGEIQSDFSEIKVENQHKQSSGSGAIGTNGPRMAINCERGTIEIRKGTVAVAPPAPPAMPGMPAKPGKPLKAMPAPKAPPVESEN
jgi:DUF4097 and DUF4098 domain-containing protein YvlB